MSDCPRCGRTKHRGRCKQGGKKPTTEKVEAPAGPAPPETPALEMPGGIGFRAYADDGQLRIEQDVTDADDGETYTHTIRLALHEAARLIDWIALHAGTRD
jgi:hypothetical protein